MYPEQPEQGETIVDDMDCIANCSIDCIIDRSRWEKYTYMRGGLIIEVNGLIIEVVCTGV